MESLVNVRGWVGNVVELRQTAKGEVLKLRLATTARHWRDGQWVDGDTVWITVTAWRALARNAASSIRKGDPVLVSGKLRSESWVSKAGELHEDKVLEAVAIGHDLSKGQASFRRVRHDDVEQERAEDRGEEGAMERVLAEYGPEGLGEDVPQEAEAEPLGAS